MIDSDLRLHDCLLQAGVLEASARKAGNVHPEASFPDLTFMDFVRSAAEASVALVENREQPLGETVLNAIRATRQVVKTNTNLGIVLLLAPLSKAKPDNLRGGVGLILEATTVADSIAIFEAIRLASPGGLGNAKEQDVHDAPTLPLRDVMALAADRDLIARQYANGFQDVFDLGASALVDGFRRFGALETAIQHCQLVWLAHHPDSLILRKCGSEIAGDASCKAKSILDVGGMSSDRGRLAYQEFDSWLRADGHARNPGTTADLIAACLFVALRERTIPLVSDSGRETRPGT